MQFNLCSIFLVSYIASYKAHAQFSQQMDKLSKVLSTNPDKVWVWPDWPGQVRARQDKEVSSSSYINIHFLVLVCSWDFSPIQIQLKIEMIWLPYLPVPVEI